jgi:oxygen-independent coproporphyrinogen-3 oxidase
LHWNALGVTSGRYHDIIGLGLHSYSTLGDYYFQNFLELRDYELAVTNGKFPIHRGHILNRDDKIRRDVIKTLRNFFFLNYVDIEEKYDMEFKEYFKEEIVALAKFSEDGLLELSDNRIIINELGYQFTDLFCSVFDSYI